MPNSRLALVVEDDSGVARFVKEVLNTAFNVECAQKMAAGLERLARKPQVSLLILDLYLPNGRGLEVMRTFQEKFPDVPVIVITGEPINPDEVIVEGAQDFLCKPFTAATLQDAAIKAITRHQVRRVFQPIKRCLEPMKCELEKTSRVLDEAARTDEMPAYDPDDCD